jgi:energy-coupling factor transporter ATP-binding protein EcfA2
MESVAKQRADPWFDCDIELNPDMIAIIGNKGSGKSALADILALAGETSRYDDFSFLDKKKFREKKLAANFEVTATWEDGTETVHNLQDDPDPNRPENIKYIPQTYLETVCTERQVAKCELAKRDQGSAESSLRRRSCADRRWTTAADQGHGPAARACSRQTKTWLWRC